MRRSIWRQRLLTLGVFLASLMPLAVVAWQAVTDNLGANPIKEITDVVERPFITVGFLSFVLLIPLAVTSTTKMIKRLGGMWWQRLHRLIYGIAVGGVVHYLWLVKADVQPPLLYGGLVALLLGYRVWVAYG